MIPTTTPVVRHRGRASKPGPGGLRLVVAAGIVVLVLASAVGVILMGRGDSAAAYGSLPAWLPKATVATNRVVQASSAHPALAIEGDTVSVHLAHGRVTATAIGPAVPEDGAFPVPPTSPCTFTVTLAAARGAVPLSAAAFTILDELGHVHHPHVVAARTAALPKRILPGQSLTLIVTDVLPTGGGRLRWAPTGPKPIASWDFDVEID